MNKITLLGIVTLIGSTTVLTAQFSAYSTHDSAAEAQQQAYANLINSEGWSGQIDWTPSTAPSGIDPSAIMNIVFIGNSGNLVNNLGLHWAGATGPFGNSFNPFDVPQLNPLAPGQFVSVALGEEIHPFDFWLTLPSNYSRINPTETVWSLFNPDLNTDNTGDRQIEGRGTVREVNGETYFLYSFQTPNNNGSLLTDDNLDNLRFMIHLTSSDGTPTAPFTAVPEPSTYGLFGALLLAGLIAGKRLRKRTTANE